MFSHPQQADNAALSALLSLLLERKQTFSRCMDQSAWKASAFQMHFNKVLKIFESKAKALLVMCIKVDDGEISFSHFSCCPRLFFLLFFYSIRNRYSIFQGLSISGSNNELKARKDKL